MANSGIYEDDYLTDPGSDEDLDADSNFENSPADGYFEQRPHPQDTFVENSSVTAAAEAKSREAAEARASSSAAVPPSQISSVASSPRSMAWTDVETPSAANNDAPPDYESATANRSADTTLPTSSRASDHNASQEPPQSSSSYGSMPFTQRVHEPGIAPSQPLPMFSGQWPFGNANNPFNSPNFPFGPNGFPGPFGPNTQSSNPPAQRMSDPVPGTVVPVDEETGLLSQRRKSPSKRKHSFWRRCCKPISTCNAVLIIAIVFLIVLIAGNADDRDTNGGDRDGGDGNKKPVSPPLSPTPSPLPSPQPSIPPSRGTCAFDYYSDPAFFDFGDIQNFSFVELIESSNYLTGGIIGQIRIKPADSERDSDIRLSVSYATTKPWKVESSNYYMTDEKFVLQLPKLKHNDEAAATSRPCLGVYVNIYIKQGIRLDNWEVASGSLDVVIEDGLFNRNAGQEKLSAFGVNKYSIFNTIRGNIQASYWSSRETEIDTVSGSIKGTLALLDRLAIKTHSGTIRLSVDPKDADPDAVRPADFVVISTSGSVHVEFPTTSSLPLRDYQSRIETQSGSVAGTYILGSITTFSTVSGTVKPQLIPVYSSTSPSKFHIDTKSASQTVNIMRPHQHPGNFARLPMDHKYTTLSGSLHLSYPQEWEGYIEGETLSGSIHLKGKDLRVIKEGRETPVFKHIVARKGTEGNGKIGFKTTSGSMNLQVGDL